MPDEVRKYVLGYYGEIAGPIDPNLFDRIANGAEPARRPPRRPARARHPETAARARTISPRDDDLLLAAFYPRSEFDALQGGGPDHDGISARRTPLVTLRQGDRASGRDIRSFHFVTAP